MQNVFLFLIAALLTSACANTPPESIPIEQTLSQKGFKIEEQVKRIQNNQINGWSSIDRFSVIINVGASKNYLVTLRNPCDGLRSAEHLAFSTTIGGLTDKDRLVVRGGGGYLEQCFVDGIFLLKKIGGKS